MKFNFQEDIIALCKKKKWDTFYTLPYYVENYIKIMKFELPLRTIHPWTTNRCVSFFENGEYVRSVSYGEIKYIMSKKKPIEEE